jgi:hypothetical protein
MSRELEINENVISYYAYARFESFHVTCIQQDIQGTVRTYES